MANPSSDHVPILEEFKTSSGILGWIDVLDVQEMGEERLEKLFSIMSTFSPSYSTMGFAPGQSVQSVNSILVGDTLCLAQVDHSIGSQFMTTQTALMFSQLLFSEDFPHRGVVTVGPYEAKHPKGGLPYIIGRAVTNAYKTEKNLKVSGIVITENALNLVPAFKNKNIGNEMIRSKSAICGHYFLSSKLHLSVWKKFTDQAWSTHSYTAAAKTITDQPSDEWI